MKLDYETVYRAVKGDHDAQEKLLQYYDAQLCGDTITTVLAGNAVIQIVSTADSSGYRCSFCTGEQRCIGTNGVLRKSTGGTICDRLCFLG